MAKTRSIFEEVGEKDAAPAPALKAARVQPDRRGIAVWLAILFALIVAMSVASARSKRYWNYCSANAKAANRPWR